MTDIGKEREEEQGFRVIDKRSRVDEEENKPSATETEKKGDGFVMSPKDEAAAHPEDIDFATLVYSFATSAMISLGKVQDPQTGKPTDVNLPLAKQNIDILAMLQAKTRGNLSGEENAMLEHFVTELRLLFVEATKKAK